LDGSTPAPQYLFDVADGFVTMLPHQLVERSLRVLAAVNARRSEEYDCILDVLGLEPAQRLQVLGQDADRTGVLALEKGGIEIRLSLLAHLPIINAQWKVHNESVPQT
jgi:hypothetical protein